MAGTYTLEQTKRTILGTNEFNGDYNIRYRIPYTVLATADGFAGTDTTEDVVVTIGTLPAKWLVNRCLVNITTAFANGTGTLIMALGTTTSSTAFMTATTIAAAGVIQPANGCNAVADAANATGTAAANLIATITAGDVAAASATAGELDVYLNIIDLNNV